MNYTAEQLEAAVAAARAEGESKIAAAIAAERERFAAIIKSPEAKGKEQQAIAIAMSGVSAAQATQILASAQPDQQPLFLRGQRASEAPGGLVIEPAHSSSANPDAAGNHGWNGVVAEINKATAAENGAR